MGSVAAHDCNGEVVGQCCPRNEQREQKPDMTFHKTLIGLYALVLQDPSASVFWVGF